MRYFLFFFSIFIPCSTISTAQTLNAGFEKSEYLEMIKINQKTHIQLEKWAQDTAIPYPNNFDFIRRSPEVGFDNLWDLWIHKTEKVGLISIRGSVATDASFLANFYAAMVPATGKIQIKNDVSFHYKLADNPQAAVHVGWLVSLAFLSNDIEQQIDSCYKKGIKEFILTGHSQGGGITFLLTAYLKHLQKDQKLPGDIQFKTYCSAGPKPGNLFFAYDYESITAYGWAFNIINSVDWVPEVPFSVQTIQDLSPVNPFHGAKEAISKQKFPKKIFLKRAYNQMTKPSIKARENYEEYLGNFVSKMAVKQLPGYTPPQYFKSNYYVRTGNTIVLQPDEEYFKRFDNSPENKNIWLHHLSAPYLYLIKKMTD